MRTLLSALLLVPAMARAADEPKLNQLTPKEIEAGWILLFDGKTTFGWSAPEDSKWKIEEGALVPEGDKPSTLVTTTAFGDYELAFEYKAKTPDWKLLLRSDAKGGQPGGGLLPGPSRETKDWWKVRVTVEGAKTTEHRADLPGSSIGYVSLRSDPIGEGKRDSGHIAVTGTGFTIRNIKLRPLKPTALFNGKDLKGWKLFEGDAARKKSEFTVTKDGWLGVKNGPGDLQSEGQWADFLLQLECKTNGKNLNSGIFFRCLPGEYQMGYEAQVHNGFQEAEKEYTLEIYDPATHELKEKRKEKFKAIDYGTGAIYRRIPARFQVSKDDEWFAMTVAAQARHLATWVNGVQVVDWTDNRPLAANARQGAYLKKGPISIQGHDPTTDLLFRNFRIAEVKPMPEMK